MCHFNQNRIIHERFKVLVIKLTYQCELYVDQALVILFAILKWYYLINEMESNYLKLKRIRRIAVLVNEEVICDYKQVSGIHDIVLNIIVRYE